MVVPAQGDGPVVVPAQGDGQEVALGQGGGFGMGFFGIFGRGTDEVLEREASAESRKFGEGSLGIRGPPEEEEDRTGGNVLFRLNGNKVE